MIPTLTPEVRAELRRDTKIGFVRMTVHVDHLLALLDLADERDRLVEWQPISTAPRNGKVIDVWVQSIFYDADGKEQVAVEFRLPGTQWYQGVWSDEAGNLHPYLDRFKLSSIRATHWRQLPPAPGASNAE